MSASLEKMLQVFPLASKTLRFNPAADSRNRHNYSASDVTQLAKETGVLSVKNGYSCSWKKSLSTNIPTRLLVFGTRTVFNIIPKKRL